MSYFLSFNSLTGSQGVLEAIRMCLAGYPARVDQEEFVEKFQDLAPYEVNTKWETYGKKRERERVKKPNLFFSLYFSEIL